MVSVDVNSIEILGADEQRTSAWWPLARTDFDNAWMAIRDRFEEEYKWDLVNPKLWSLVGLNGGPIKEFLQQYMSFARSVEKEYRKQDYAVFWKPRFRKYGYEDWKIDAYFRALRLERERGLIADTIYKPWDYTPTVENPGAKIARTAAVYGIVALGIYALAKGFGRGLGGRILK